MLFISKGRFRSVNDMYAQLRNNDERNFLDDVAAQMKGAKIRITHLGHSKKFKGFGPRCSDPKTLFDFTDGRNGTTSKITVAQYFQLKVILPFHTYIHTYINTYNDILIIIIIVSRQNHLPRFSCRQCWHRKKS